MGTDGQWVRTYNDASAQLFLAERERELAKLAAHRKHLHEVSRRAWRTVRAQLSVRKQPV